MTLRLIKPSTGGQSTRPPKGRRSAALSLTPEETRHFRAALRNVARALGGHAVLASIVGVPVHTLHRAFTRRPSAGLVLRVAQAGGMSMNAVIGPALSEAGRCSSCGSRIGAGRAAS